MSILTEDERREVSKRLVAAGNANLALLIVDVLGESAEWVAGQKAAVIAADIGGKMLQSRETTIGVCNWLVTTFPGRSGDNAAIAAILKRLGDQILQSAADPIDESWIGPEPMVNRGSLRGLLRQIVDGHNHGVIYVAGPRMSGRSHSWHLIRHVARQSGIGFHRIDFTHETEARTIGHIYAELKRACGLNNIGDPTHEGATPADVAFKFAARLRQNLAICAPVTPKPWIVIDFTDEVIDPAVPEFIRLFCTDRDNSIFDNCVIFVLGPLTHLETMRHLANLDVEELGPVSESEILAAARMANNRGAQPIAQSDLDARVSDIYGGLAALSEDERYPAMRRALIALRREVRAP